MRGIDTTWRKLYLNSYAYLLIMIAVGVAVIPLYLWGFKWWLAILQGVGVYLSLRGAVTIMRAWPDKQRKYHILMEKNRDELRPDTFRQFMDAPCGRLLARVVIADLGYPNDTYRRVKREAAPRFWRNCRATFAPAPSSTERIVIHKIDKHRDGQKQ
ncbi:MAG: hypothetical protein K2L93_07645 [Muribaculaceae bacterium]|nr:hypothetical protein [Muribaculaceae bacterium]